MWGWHSGWGWFWMSVSMVVFWGLVAWVAVTLIRQSGSTTEQSGAREVLDERFARGEIDEAEYERRRDLIRK